MPAWLDEVNQENQDFSRKKMLSGEDFFGGEVQNSVNLPMVRFFGQLSGADILRNMFRSETFWKK